MPLVKKNQIMPPRLGNINLESQNHPGLTPESPFDILIEYGRGIQKELKGDVHYCLQMSIVLCGEAEVVCGSFRRIYRKNELWWTMCWEPHAFRLIGKRNLILTVNINEIVWNPIRFKIKCKFISNKRLTYAALLVAN